METVKKSRWLTAAIIAVVFVLGVLTGGFATRARQQRQFREFMFGDPAAVRTRLTLFALERRLDLTPSQRAEAERLLRDQEVEYRAAVEPCRPRVRALRQEMARKLSPVLEPEQRAILEEILQRGDRAR